MTEPWLAKPGCPEQFREALERKVNSFPSAWLQPPYTGEISVDFDQAKDRLRAFALVAGFDVVVVRRGSRTCLAGSFACYQHATATKNWRHLNERIRRDDQGVITSDRQREHTHVIGSDYPWRVNVSYKDVPRRGSGVKKWVTTVLYCLYKGHPLLDNPLVIDAHL